MEANQHSFLVLVRRIDLKPAMADRPMASIVKYSRQGHALPDADFVKLATAQHYRRYDGEGPGIGDETEATYVKSLLSYLEKWNPEVAARHELQRGYVSGSITHGTDDQWLYCTARYPRSAEERTRLLREFDADCVTHLGDPTTLARELGSAVGQMSPAPAVERNQLLHRLQDSMLHSQSAFDRIVRVDHGPVAYADDAGVLVEAVPQQHRVAAVPFVKRVEFADQREYRFAVSTIGSPADSVLLVPATPQLRSLASIVN